MNLLDLICIRVTTRSRRAESERLNRKLGVPSSSSLGDVKLGVEANVTVGENSYMNSGYLTGRVIIGDYCAIGYNVSLIGATHDPKHPTGPLPIPLKRGTVTVEDYVWIGNNVVVLPGVTVRRHGIVGANAVVTRDVQEHSTVVGAPAKMLRLGVAHV